MIVEVDQTIEVTPTAKTIIFKYTGPAKPGQFIMVWVPGIDEVPMSLSHITQWGITVARVGEATEALHQLEPRDLVGVRGPYGNGFTVGVGDEKILVVGGGIGAAPLLPFSSLDKVTAVIGATTASELLFVDRFPDARVATDDGTAGYRGLASELTERTLEENDYDQILTCGPEAMMRAVVELGSRHGIGVQACLERYMKCGIGLCGQCCIDGHRVCTDGPVFDGETLRKIKEFGKFRRDPSGRRVPIR